VISAESVTKRFGELAAVKDASFSLGIDEIVGFVGPNGAGKSTMLKMLATFLHPTSGRLLVDGLDVVKQPLAVRRRIGYLPGDTPLYQEMRADRFLDFIARAHGLRGGRLKERLDWVIENCSLTSVLAKKVKECSTGFRKRIGLAASQIPDPQVILLDEPTHGLDPLQVLAFRELLRRLRPGRTILLSSHVIAEVAAICDRLLIIHEGRLLADGTLAELCGKMGLPEGDLEGLFIRLVQENSTGAGEAQRAAEMHDAVGGDDGAG
jgi:ABC-2 type transport system ATP-binding protein